MKPNSFEARSEKGLRLERDMEEQLSLEDLIDPYFTPHMVPPKGDVHIACQVRYNNISDGASGIVVKMTGGGVEKMYVIGEDKMKEITDKVGQPLRGQQKHAPPIKKVPAWKIWTLQCAGFSWQQVSQLYPMSAPAVKWRHRDG
jgi:hypothetical protein